MMEDLAAGGSRCQSYLVVTSPRHLRKLARPAILDAMINPMSVPAETPAEVTYLSASTQRETLSHSTFGPMLPHPVEGWRVGCRGQVAA